jgi:trimethylamine--corrinoid protein Co-methyltransferase
MMPILTRDEIGRIHQVSLHLLATVGVRVDHPEVRQRLGQAGAELDPDGVSVRLPSALVARCIGSAPRNLALADRRGGLARVGADGGTVFWGGNAMYLARGRERVETTSADLEEITRLNDALPHVHGVVGASVADYPPVVRDFVGFRVMAENSTKHIRPVIFSPDGPLAILEMAEAIADGPSLADRPIVSFGYSIVSPFHWSRTALDLFLRTSGRGLPMMVNSEPLAGGTAPITLAGLLTQANAEALSGIAILQVLEPGRPCVFNLGFAHMLDMRGALATSAAVQDGLIAAAGAEIARYHGLPSASWISSDNPICDAQSALEKALTGMLHARAGVNIIWGIGQLETELTLSLEQAVIDDEMAGQLLRAQRGIEVNDETIALAVIEEGARTGDFLGHEHTLRHYREEQVAGKLTAPQRRTEWLAAGGLDLVQRAARKVEDVLSQPRQPAVSPDQSARLQEIERKWLARLA